MNNCGIRYSDAKKLIPAKTLKTQRFLLKRFFRNGRAITKQIVSPRRYEVSRRKKRVALIWFSKRTAGLVRKTSLHGCMHEVYSLKPFVAAQRKSKQKDIQREEYRKTKRFTVLDRRKEG